jgi:hypothetical protein
MLRRIGLEITAAALAVGTVAYDSNTPAKAQTSGVSAGTLTCNVSSGWGFIFGSSRELRCSYSRPGGGVVHYTGHVDQWGVDIGYTQEGVIVWGVLAPTANVAPGALAGSYGGVTASATVGVGVGANVLVGGSNKTISLQPLSVEGNTGLNVAGGIGAITLRYQGNR